MGRSSQNKCSSAGLPRYCSHDTCCHYGKDRMSYLEILGCGDKSVEQRPLAPPAWSSTASSLHFGDMFTTQARITRLSCSRRTIDWYCMNSVLATLACLQQSAVVSKVEYSAFRPLAPTKPLTSTKLFGILQQSFVVPCFPSQATLITS